MQEAAICIENYSLKRSNRKEDLSYIVGTKEPYVIFKDYLNYFCHACFRFIYLTLGVFQFFAIQNAFSQTFHSGNILISIVSFIFAYTPILGPILAIYGAYSCWDWEFSSAVVIFILPYLLVHAPLIMIVLLDIYKDTRRWKIEENV